MITKCRTCGGNDLHHILSLGETPLANDFLNPGDPDGPKYPLDLWLCKSCTLVQLGEVIAPEILYSRYAYVTSTSETMKKHLANEAEFLLSLCKPSPKVLEIASNTGNFLKEFKARGCNVFGVEPARNIAEIADKDGIPTSAVFFNSDMASKIGQQTKFNLIVGRHVLAHIDDLSDLLKALDMVASPDAVIAFEVPYIVDFLNKTEFDTVYHEHLSYFSVVSIMELLRDSPFKLVDVIQYEIHGGSILFVIKRTGDQNFRSITYHVSKESILGVQNQKTWEVFDENVSMICAMLKQSVQSFKKKGKRIIGYGASAKGNTLLNVCGLTSEHLDFVIDNTPFKQGKICPGSRIPIRPPSALLEEQPDYALLLAWNFADEIIAREQEYQRRGGRFIIPIPEPRVVEFRA